MTEPTSRCAHCGEVKPLSEFHKRRRPGYTSTFHQKRIAPDAPHCYCKLCNNGWRKIMAARRALAAD